MTLDEFKAERGLSLTDLALLLDVPISTVNGWFRGRRKPDVDLLGKISDATGGVVTPAELRPDLARLLQPRPKAARNRVAA